MTTKDTKKIHWLTEAKIPEDNTDASQQRANVTEVKVL